MRWLWRALDHPVFGPLLFAAGVLGLAAGIYALLELVVYGNVR